MSARPFRTFTATTTSGRTYTQDIDELPEGTVIYVHPEEGTPYEYRLQRDINNSLAWFAYRDGKTVNPNFGSDGATIVRYALQRPKRATITTPTGINGGTVNNNMGKKEENTMNNKNNGAGAAPSITDELLAALARKETHHALADYAAKTAARATKKARAIHHNIRTATPTADAPRSAATTGTEGTPRSATKRRRARQPGRQPGAQPRQPERKQRHAHHRAHLQRHQRRMGKRGHPQAPRRNRPPQQHQQLLPHKRPPPHPPRRPLGQRQRPHHHQLRPRRTNQATVGGQQRILHSHHPHRHEHPLPVTSRESRA